MKVGRWRREKLGQGSGSHTTEVILVLFLLVLFGIYRLYGAAEIEEELAIQQHQLEQSSDNIILFSTNETILAKSDPEVPTGKDNDKAGSLRSTSVTEARHAMNKTL
jgi:hypothetical protein